MSSRPGGSSCVLDFAPTETGCRLRVRGRATARESRAARDAAMRWLKADAPAAAVVLDLSECEYLDSTFLGCLLELHRAGGTGGRFTIAAPPDRRAKLFGAMKLDRILKCADACDAGNAGPGQWIDLPAASGGDPRELMRHIMESHRRLADAGGPMAKVFARIADELQRELSSPSGGVR